MISTRSAVALSDDYDAAVTWATLAQVVVAFLIAGFGNVGAGLILDHVKEWPVFLHVDELFILVPSLLGLKGNLEMTMASRLSTQANLGHMNDANELLKMAKGNLALVQCQATVVSFLVSLFASFVKSVSLSSLATSQVDSLMSTSTPMLAYQHANATGTLNSHTRDPIRSSNSSLADAAPALDHSGGLSLHSMSMTMAPETGFNWDNALILCASSLLTANIACFVLGTMMILIIVGSNRISIDPDNVAAPVAASLGDMITAALLAVIAHSVYHYSVQEQFPYMALVITLLFLAALPVWFCVAKTNPYTSDVITKGWTPIVLAVFISSCGGFILEHGKARFSQLPVFQPVVNGVGGNLVAVQASRLSTALHKSGKPGYKPITSTTLAGQKPDKLFIGPVEIFLSKNKSDINLTTARLLLLISIPAHLLYFFVILLTEPQSSSAAAATSVQAVGSDLPIEQLPQLGIVFLATYLAFAVLQVALLLYLAHNLVALLWRYSIDPDNYSTPLLTATGDLLGCAFLLCVFLIAA